MATPYPVLRLIDGKDIHLRNRHHAIFRNAVQAAPAVEDGAIVEVQSAGRDFLCYATWNSKAFIAGRAIAFEKGDPLEQLRAAIERAIAMRAAFFGNEDTDCCRLVNAEGDAVPGLIVDRYGEVLAVQCTTLGMEKLRDWATGIVKDATGARHVFEKSTAAARKKEGLGPREGWLTKGGPASVDVRERGLKFRIDLEGSQKTGLFLDQREMRSLVRSLAAGRTVLDCCSYVGGFSVAALAGGALAADAVDYDPAAIKRAREHVKMNGIDAEKFGAHRDDVFHFLRQRPLPRRYDLIILDPPAFAKRSSDIDLAKKAYTDLNRLALEILQPGSLLLTCSCSYQMDPALFQTTVFHAAKQAKRFARILHRHRQALDHPININHPEVDYLKSLLLWVE